MSEYIPIKVETVRSFADEARRIGGVEDELSTAEMLDTFGNAEIVKNQNVTITENGTYTPEEGHTGFGTVTVNIDSGGTVLPDNAYIYYKGKAESVLNSNTLVFESSAVRDA